VEADDGRGGGDPLTLLQLHIGWCTKVTEQQSGGTDVCCCSSGRWRAERQRIIFHSISGWLSSRCPGSQRTAQTLTVCAPFSIIIWIFSYPDIGSKIRYPEFWISINNTNCTVAFKCFYYTMKFVAWSKRWWFVCSV